MRADGDHSLQQTGSTVYRHTYIGWTWRLEGSLGMRLQLWSQNFLSHPPLSTYLIAMCQRQQQFASMLLLTYVYIRAQGMVWAHLVILCRDEKKKGPALLQRVMICW
jgi:hypothetical protein